MRGPFGPSGRATATLPPLARDNRNASGLDRVPIIVVDVGAVETLDHLGGAGASFDGLEDAEGDEGAAVHLRLRRLTRAALDHLCPTCALLPCHCLTAPDCVAITALMPSPSLPSDHGQPSRTRQGDRRTQESKLPQQRNRSYKIKQAIRATLNTNTDTL